MKPTNLCSVLLLLLLSSNPTEAQVNWSTKISFRPFAIYNDGISTSTIRVDARGLAVTGLSIKLKSAGNITFTAAGYTTPAMSFSLFDDGTHGDEMTNDGIFSLGEVKTNFSLGSKEFQRVHVELTADSLMMEVYYPSFFVVRDENFNVDLTDNNTISSDFAIAFFGLPDRGNIWDILRKFYRMFPDAYDFVLVYRERIPEWSGAYIAVKNDVKGIGRPLFNHCSEYGSGGRLQGILSFGTDEEQLTAELNGTVMHEFGHRWGAYLSDSALPLSDGAHWYNNSTIVGMLNTCCSPFVFVGSGAFRHYCSFRFNRFAPIELYTMGAFSKQELDSDGGVYVLVDPNIGQTSNSQIPCDSIVSPATFVKVTSDSIVKIYGEREPSSPYAQKTFRTATILVTERKPTAEEICVWNRFLRHYSAPYDRNDPYGADWESVPSFANYTAGRLSNDFRIETPTFVEQLSSGEPKACFLYQNFPNPFNPSTTIEFTISHRTSVALNIHNLLGVRVTNLVSQTLAAGRYRIQWLPNGLPSGVYFYQLQAGGYNETKKLILLR